MIEITYIEGDATEPVGEGAKFIAHICNDIGGWGSGFVLALSKKWSQPEKSYREWFKNRHRPDTRPFELGQVKFSAVGQKIYVANMIGQHRTGMLYGPPIRYPALQQCLETVAFQAINMYASVHMPRIGCGLAGGSWAKVEALIIEELTSRDVPVFVYDFPGTTYCP